MATYYSLATGNWSTLANWNTAADGSGSAPASVAAMDNETFIIQAGHTITLDVDISAHTNGVAGLTIESHATDPGMLVCPTAAGNYGLKIKTGTSIVGTNAAVFGRILANSDGVWGNTGAVPANITFLISLDGTGFINAQYLDIALRCTEPTIASVATYGTKLAVSSIDTGTDTITLGSAHGWAANTPVMIQSTGTLPGGLSASAVYYVTSPSGADLKLALVSSGTAVDITSAGTGTIEVYSGHTSTSTAVMNVLADVTGDAQWATGASVVLSDCNDTGNYDQQRVTLSAVAAGTITLSANVDSAQFPGAIIYLMTRNVAIRSNTTTTTNIVSYPTAATHGGVFGCEIRSTAGTGTTFYGNGVYGVYGSGHTISGTVSGCNNGVYYGSGHTISGTVSGCKWSQLRLRSHHLRHGVGV
jgi:hypothetical protein